MYLKCKCFTHFFTNPYKKVGIVVKQIDNHELKTLLVQFTAKNCFLFYKT